MEIDATQIGIVGIISMLVIKECFAFARSRNGHSKVNGDGFTKAESATIVKLNELLIHQKRTVGLLEKLVEKS